MPLMEKCMREFTKYWVISNVAYTIGIFCMMILYISPEEMLIVPWMIPICNLTGTLSIFYACCAANNILHKHFWGRYILLLLLYGVVSWYCSVDLIVIAIPFLLYHLMLLAVTLFTIFWKWQFPTYIKDIVATVLLGHVVSQILYSFALIQERTTPVDLFLNMLFLILMNFVSAILYKKSLAFKERLQNDYIHMMAENAVDILFYYTFQPFERFTFISPSVENLTGYKQNDFYKNPKFYLEITHEKDREIIEKAFSSQAFLVNQNYVRWQKKDGEFAYMEFHNNPIYVGGELIAMEGILRDISSRVQADQEMADAKRARQILLSYVSHELKTPITYITGYAELLHGDVLENEAERKKAAGLILSKAIFLQNLVDDLFQLSRMESNQFSFEFMQTKIYELHQVLNEEHQNEIFSTKISGSLELADELKDGKYEVLVDIKRIRQVYGNLLHNAIKHTPDSGTIKCRCFLDLKKENIIFEVVDSGDGIAKEDLPNIFNAFYKGTNNRRVPESSGLGLSLSEQIVTAHRGKIEALSKENQGSTFRFSLPLYEEG